MYFCAVHPLQLIYTQAFSIAVPLDLFIHPCWTRLAQLACDVLLSPDSGRLTQHACFKHNTPSQAGRLYLLLQCTVCGNVGHE